MKKLAVPDRCLTALVTPFNADGTINWKGFEKNIRFQVLEGVAGLVPVGTTGESPTLSPEEHALVITRTADWVANDWVAKGGVFVLAGCGSNSTEEALHYTGIAAQVGCNGALLVDCYYNGPSSLELRERYYRVVAEKFPELVIVPYIIPGRTGCALSVTDLAILAWECPNIRGVKEASGDLERMRKTREELPKEFRILSGDDDKTFTMLTDSKIQADGVISVISNIAPRAVQKMCENALLGELEEAQRLKEALEPLFKVVTVKKERKEKIPGRGEEVVEDKFRNPLPIKTMMAGLGMPAGPCRPPLGKMTYEGVEEVRRALKTVWENNPEILMPIEEFYGVSISERLADDKIWRELAYP